MLDLDAKTCLLNVIKNYLDDLSGAKREIRNRLREKIESSCEVTEGEVRQFTSLIGYIDNKIQALEVIQELYSKDLPF